MKINKSQRYWPIYFLKMPKLIFIVTTLNRIEVVIEISLFLYKGKP